MVRIVAMDHRFENLVKNVEYLSAVLLTRVYFDLYYKDIHHFHLEEILKSPCLTS